MRIAAGPVKYKILVQVANDGDVVDDATIHWPEDRKVVEFGTLSLTAPVADNDTEQKHISSIQSRGSKELHLRTTRRWNFARRSI